MSITSSNNSWINALIQAREELNIEGFYPVKKGTQLYNLAKEIQLDQKNKSVYGGTKRRCCPCPRSSRSSRKRSSSNKRKPSTSRSKGKRSWIQSVSQARKELKITGFYAIKKGTPLYKRAKEIQEGN